jgi:Yip1-like protein
VTETTAPESGMAAPKGLAARFLGVLTSPRETYADIVRRPAWLGMFVLLVVIGAGCGGWLTSTAIGRRAAVDEATRMMDSLGISSKIPQERLNEMRDQMLNAPDWKMYRQATLGALFIYGICTAILAGILLGIFNAVLGGDARFKQVFAVVMFSEAVLATKALFVTPLNYVRESLSNPTSFAALAPMLDDNGLPAKMLGSIDFFWLWWIISLSIGLGVLYKRPTRGIAIALMSVYVVLAVSIAAVVALIRG